MITNFDVNLIGKEDMFVCGDCMEYMKQMPDKCVELAIVDPPYGVKYARGKNGWGICDNRPDLKEVQWDNVPKKEYFDELIRISKNQIIWGGEITIQTKYQFQNVGLCGIKYVKQRIKAYLPIAN